MFILSELAKMSLLVFDYDPTPQSQLRENTRACKLDAASSSRYALQIRFEIRRGSYRPHESIASQALSRCLY